MESNEERAHVYVSGNVQGVFFRDSTRQKAKELGLAGWVKNTPDGRVEAVFEGPSSEVRQMVDWCENGPSQADVEDVEAEYSEPEGNSEGFEVR
ncbi:MAG TPA: acylphosphatase [Rubrobacteraceae bacterium]|nr:acylphosphatase [Rubrobacteraceae bacterium]